jgi:hypothetical protein
MFGTCDMLPTAIREEAMVAAGNQSRPVCTSNAVGGFDRPPLIEDLGFHKTPIGALGLRAIYAITPSYFGDGLRSAVGHEDRRVTS